MHFERIKITDPRALDALVSIEGERWRTEQSRFGGYSFDAALKGWREAQKAAAVMEDIQPGDVREMAQTEDGWQGVIYGAGGWHRYNIDENGGLFPIRSSFLKQEKWEHAVRMLMVEVPD